MKFAEDYHEKVRYQYLPRTDCHDNRAAEIADYEYGKEYSEVILAASQAALEAIAEQVDEVYQEIGAKVLHGISCSGEDPARLHLR